NRARIEREGAFASIFDAGEIGEARIERRLVDADNTRSQPLQHPGPAAGTGAEIDATLRWLRPLAQKREQLPQFEIGAARRGAVFNEARLAVRERARARRGGEHPVRRNKRPGSERSR